MYMHIIIQTPPGFDVAIATININSTNPRCNAILTNHCNIFAILTNHSRLLPPYLCIMYRATANVWIKRLSPPYQNTNKRPWKAVAWHSMWSEGKLFCAACNSVVEHKKQLSIDKHFATAKHKMRMAEMQAGCQTTRQMTLIQATASRATASSERIKVSCYTCAWLV